MKREKTIEETYKQYTPYEHIINRPDTYVGSLEFQKDTLWVFNSKENKLEEREVKYVPGLFKIFDEIIVNAADNYQRDKSMKFIKVDIDQEKNVISIKNGGRGIPIEIHGDYKIYVPELIFGKLLTSSNYDDNEKKVTGGRNGYGAKLTNIFSKKFIVETADKKQKKYYKQVFSNNMLKISTPEISSYHKEDFTCITFEPDLKKFKMDCLDDDIISIFQKRVYDLAGITPSSVEVFLNGKKLEVKNFSSYMDMFLEAEKEEDEEDPVKIFESPHERWEVGISLEESQFQQVSFVNSICTSKGGTHVQYVTDKIVSVILDEIQKKNKGLVIRANHVRQHLWVFVNCSIENPAFDSQTKETLNTKSDSFGSSFEFSEKFIKKVLKSGIIERCLRFAKTREEEKNLKKINAKCGKKARLIGIDKLEDANDAGTKRSENCTLILTEGDSAKSLAMAGIELVGRQEYGCFPLRGKMLNVRDASTKQISKNQEVQHLMKILGIRIGETYTDTKNLRYGAIMIMTDQDVDGSHIKGLIINFIHSFWPSLLKIKGFMQEFITPIIKATKGKECKEFYTIPQYKQWVDEKGGRIKGWKIKYYKGLGTSTTKEAKEYFKNINKNRIDFQYKNDKDDECIQLAFNKKKAEDRKKWLMSFNPNTPPLDTNVKTLTYQDFVEKELILFSIYDNQRSIPSLCDGLKPSERKILFGCFKKNLKEEIKVAQLVGYISEHSAYHHGEQSLSGTIVAMAQNFVGSNNINLLLPLGQFGTRNGGGKDSASARYIYTNLNKVTRHLFNQHDLPLMNYIVEEGQKIEPVWYLPIIPLILVNGTEGIGTGWSTQIPCFNPHDIVQSIKNKINNGHFSEIHPWYKGYTGKIEKSNKPGVFNVQGTFYWSENDDSTLFITELPIKKWTKDYKNFLYELMGSEMKPESEKKQKGKKKKEKKEENEKEAAEKKKKTIILENIQEHHANNRIKFELKILPDFVAKLKEDPELVYKTFKLSTTINLTNMVLFSHEGKIRKYTSVESILEEFYYLRLEYYDKRKKHMVSVLKRDVAILNNKARFILAVINEEIILRKVKRNDIILLLVKMNFDPISKLEAIRIKSKEEKEAEVELINANKDEEEENETDLESLASDKKGHPQIIPAKEYDYLLSMPLWSLTYEKVEELENLKVTKEEELRILEQKDITTLWSEDLDTFIEVLDQYEAEEEEDRLISEEGEGVKGKKRSKKDQKRQPKDKKNPPKNQKSIEAFANVSEKKVPKNNKENNKTVDKDNIKSDDYFKLALSQRLKKEGKIKNDPNLGYQDKNSRKNDNSDLFGIDLPSSIKTKKIIEDE